MSHQLQWWGHASWQLKTAAGKIVLVDPWVTSNPKSPVKLEEIKADLVLITHDHFDHASDSVAVAKQTGAKVVMQPEISARYKGEGLPEDQALQMNIGGSIEVEGITITMTDAFHTSETGEPAGYIVTLEDGKRVYFAGDTGIFANMAIWAELYPLDVALLPIGSVYTMDPVQAAHALTLLRPKLALPQHYATFPALVQSADEFVRLAAEKAPDTEVRVVDPGGTCEF